MDKATPIDVRFAVPERLKGDLVKERIICSHQPQEHIPRPDSPSKSRQELYRRQLCDRLKSLHPNPDECHHQIAKLKWLLGSFVSNRSVMFKEGMVDLLGLAKQCKEAAGHRGAVNLTARANEEIFRNSALQDAVFHPLHVVVLAFFMGGPITTLCAASLSTWSPPTSSTSSNITGEEKLAHFHTEGDSGDIFEDHRITIVWEESREGEYVQSPQGVHHMFFTGDAKPQTPPIFQRSDIKLEEDNAAQVIVFDSRNAALFYEPPNATTIRWSIGFDLYVNVDLPGCDEKVGTGDCEVINEANGGKMTLGRLLTGGPSAGYNDQFHELLFSAESVEAIFTKLAHLDIGPPTPIPPGSTHDPKLQAKFDQWEAENMARAASIFNAPIRLRGTYNNMLDFEDRLRARMLKDLRRSFLGPRFFPHKPRDGDKEPARIWIRDLGMTEIVFRAGQYFPVNLPLHPQHLIHPHNLTLCAQAIHYTSLELIAGGYADQDGLLYSVGTLAQAIGDAFDAYKETRHNPEPFVHENDLATYQTRCLYLFWCADYVAGCMALAQKGGSKMKQQEAKAKKTALMRDAHALLLNYVSWCLFVEELPGRPFRVRQPVGT